MSIPQTTISVCSGVRLNSRYEHSIYFADRSAQLSYFAGKVVKTFSAYSFIRKSWDLNVAATMEEAASWSYLYFTNSANAKRYFYFIDNIEYVNDGTVRLKLQIDVLQTYMFDYEMLPCYVERQHTETDLMGEHTVEEGLETGELINNASVDLDIMGELCILVLASINPNYTDTTTPIQALGGRYNNVFSGLSVWAVDSAKFGLLSQKLDALSSAGFIDGIISMWMYPKKLVKLGGEDTWDSDNLFKVVSGADNATLSVSLPTWKTFEMDGYTDVKNNKLKCYPFNFMYMSNNSGGSAVYRFERRNVGNGVPSLKFVGAISPDAPSMVYPVDYNGVVEDTEEGLTLGNYPTCAWDSDTYKLWLAQNQNQHRMNTQSALLTVGGGAVAAIGSIATGNILGAAGGIGAMIAGNQQIKQQLAQKADMAIQPPQAKGQYSSNVNMAIGKQTFTLYHKSVTKERAKIIDDYFTMYGYQINCVQKPNIHARKSHTYIKTIGCHIDADLCNEDATKIEAIFDHGVTFWTNGNRIGQYGDDNSPL